MIVLPQTTSYFRVGVFLIFNIVDNKKGRKRYRDLAKLFKKPQTKKIEMIFLKLPYYFKKS